MVHHSSITPSPILYSPTQAGSSFLKAVCGDSVCSQRRKQSGPACVQCSLRIPYYCMACSPKSAPSTGVPSSEAFAMRFIGGIFPAWT